jgi:amidohydrolase
MEENTPERGVTVPAGKSSEMTIGSGRTSLVELRHSLHRRPELSGMERITASKVADILSQYCPAKLIRDLGGQGVAALFEGCSPGRRILLRCEMDALPIDETICIPQGSMHRGISHKCGHDGHMTILLGLAETLSLRPPASGSAVILFQPGEETGRGARAVMDDRNFRELEPDMVFALHNLPGFPQGSVIVSAGPFASASIGMSVELKGESSHASEPHLGRSPAMAVARLIEAVNCLPCAEAATDNGARATVIHARVGHEAFGTSPGDGTVMVTLRARTSEIMYAMAGKTLETARTIAGEYGLDCSISWAEEFPPTVNDPEAAATVTAAAERLGMDIVIPETPFPWSEDFGHFTAAYPGALFGLGAGVNCPALHSPGYDFPDELIDPGIRIFAEITGDILN